MRCHILQCLIWVYCNGPKFLDRQVWANSVHPDQTAFWEQSDQGLHGFLEEPSDQGLHYLPFHLHRLDHLDQLLCSKAILKK